MEENKSTVEIKTSKNMTMLLFAISLGFVIALLWILRTRGFTDANHQPLTLSMKLMMLAGIGFFSFGCVIFMLILTDKRPVLIINDQGIQINYSVLFEGFIPWSNIAGFEELYCRGNRMLLIILKDPNEIINKMSIWKQVIARLNLISCRSFIAINTSLLSIDFDTLNKLLCSRLELFKASHTPPG